MRLTALEFELDPRDHAGNSAELVRSQHPDSGLLVPRRNVIRLTTSVQNREVEVPSFKGLTAAVAEERVREAGLVVQILTTGRVTERPAKAGEVPGREVVETQSREAGPVGRGASIEIKLIRLTAAVARGRMPNLFNETLAGAKTSIEPLGLPAHAPLDPGQCLPDPAHRARDQCGSISH